LPKKYLPYQTCHRRFQQWVQAGKLERILGVMAEGLRGRGKLDLEEAFVNASFSAAKRGPRSGAHQKGQRHENVALTDDHSLPLAVSIESTPPHESQLVEGVLGHSFLDTRPTRLIGDKAYDSDRLDRDLAEHYGIEMIAPHRGERRTQLKTGVDSVAIADVGEWNDFLLGCIIWVGL
jgi:hypothetical protein